MAADSQDSFTHSGTTEWSGRFRFLLFATVAAAFFAKLYCAATTIGSNDIILFYQYAKVILGGGLAAAYDIGPLFNHPPLVALAIGRCLQWSREWDIPFPLLFRTPGIIADLITTFSLFWIVQRFALAIPRAILFLFAASPVAFMVTGYHGNTDPILTMLLTVSVVAAVAGRPVWSGLLFGLSLQVKIAPLVIAPVLFFFWLHRKKAIHFGVACAGVMLIAWLPVLFVCPGTAFRNVFGYSSYWASWGISYWLWMTHWSGFTPHSLFNPAVPQQIATTLMKAIIFGGVMLLAWHRRGRSPLEMVHTVAAAWIVFMAFAPGFCPQYMVWPAPFLFLAVPRFYAAFTLACSAFLFTFYQSTAHQFPWHFSNSTGAEVPLWQPWTLWAWALTVVWVWRERREFQEAAVSLFHAARRPRRLATAPAAQPVFAFAESPHPSPRLP